MHDNVTPHLTHKSSHFCHQFARWARSRHRAAISLVLRGACYGAGTAAASLAAYWIRNRM